MSEGSITHFYENDHDRLDELFTSFQRLKRTDFAKAAACFREFKTGLQRHIIWEEEILFPLFERKTGMTAGGPTQVMRVEHTMIKAHLEEIHALVQLRSAETEGAERKLLETLSSHNMKEEQILYPAIDRSLEQDELNHIFRSMEGLAGDRYSA
jgi:iron-sulfur cluster repair protein YtfE (RIC family)